MNSLLDDGCDGFVLAGIAVFRPILANTFAFFRSTTGLVLVSDFLLPLAALLGVATLLDSAGTAFFCAGFLATGVFLGEDTSTFCTLGVSGDFFVALSCFLLEEEDFLFIPFRFFNCSSSLYNDKSTKIKEKELNISTSQDDYLIY